MDTLKQRVFRAGGWTLVGYGLGQIIRLASSLVMTRLLVPEMFGIMAIASMVIAVLSMISDIGLMQNLVQSRRGDDPQFLDTAWVLQILRGLLLWLVALGISLGLHFANTLLPAGSVYRSPLLPVVIAVSSLSIAIHGFQSTKMSTAHRTFDLKRFTQIELTSQLAGLVVMIVAGVVTRSIWSLVAGGLVNSAARTALTHSWMLGHSNRIRWDKSSLGELIGFGKWIFVSSAFTMLALSGDRLLLGGLANPHTLGLYAIAALFVSAVENGANRLLVGISLPAMSEIVRNDPARLKEVYYRFRVPTDIILLFLAGALFSGGQVLIDLLYDARYSGAGPILQVLAVSLIASRYALAHQAYLALGMPRKVAFINAVRAVSLFIFVPALYVVDGIPGAIWGVSLHAFATVPFIYALNVRLHLNDLRREVSVLIALPFGLAVGWAIDQIFS